MIVTVTSVAYPGSIICTKLDPVSANTHPADDGAWIAYDESEVGNILCYDAARTDKSVLPNGNTTNDCTVCAETRTSSNQRGAKLTHTTNLAAWVEDVSKNHRRTAEYFILKRHAFINADVILNLNSIANTHIRAYHHILTDVAVFADPRILQDM